MKLKFIQSSLLVLSLFFVQFANAQQGTYNLEFNNAMTNCSGASPQFCVDLNIQSDAGSFNIGAHTVFFSYNMAAIDNPVYTSENFDEDEICPSGNPGYSVAYTGNSGSVNLTTNTTVIQPTTTDATCPTLTTGWTKMGTFCFDVIDDAQTAGLAFNTTHTLFNQYNNDPEVSLMQGNFTDFDGSVACPVAECAALSVSNLSSDVNTDNNLVVTLSWITVANAEAYQLAGRKTGGTTKTFPETQMTSRTFTSGIQYGTNYQWSVRVKCDGVWTSYALDGPGPATFTTPPGKNTSDFDIFASTTDLQVSLYPNPTRDNVNVQFEAPMFDFNDNSTLTISVYDVVGRQLLVKEAKTNVGQVSLNLTGFDKGYYFVEVDNGTNKAVEKLAVY
ncbi:MAG: T9SS type A sorting domain-containing protein [Chitinophagales bacterium]